MFSIFSMQQNFMHRIVEIQGKTYKSHTQIVQKRQSHAYLAGKEARAVTVFESLVPAGVDKVRRKFFIFTLVALISKFFAASFFI